MIAGEMVTNPGHQETRDLGRGSGVRVESRWWLWNASVWFGIGLFGATQDVFVMRSEGMHHAWTALFVTLLISWLPWALATPVVMRLSRQYPPVRLRPFSTWVTHLGACGAIALASAAWVAGLEELMNPWASSPDPGPFLHLWIDRFYNGLLQSMFLYAAILAVGYALDSRERLAQQRIETARLNEQLSLAQLSALRRQIEPHFLFNSLNAITALVREHKNDVAVSMIAGLSECLRRALETSRQQEVPLGDEVEFLRHYLAIQKLRFADRLHLTLDVPAELLSARVPNLILQPMVENAIKHGIARRARGGAIRITASRSNGMLTLTVYNDGPSLQPDGDQTNAGIGISNTRARLHTLYGDACAFTIRNHDPGGVEASVSVPFKEG
jgi:two-component system LytT family sensor kinase